MAWNMKGKVAKCEHREYGFAQVQISKIGGESKGADALFEGLGDELQVCHEFTPLLPLLNVYSLGLDVARRPALGVASGLPCHWPHKHRTIRCHRSQHQAILWYPIPP